MSLLAKSLTERKIPRAMISRWILENQILDLVKPGRIGRGCNGCEHYDFARGIPQTLEV